MYFEGQESKQIGEVTQDIFMNYLRAKLNGPEYSSTLGKPVFVVASEEEASQHYAGGDGGNAFVEVLIGDDERQRWGKEIDGVYHDGKRHEMTLLLDMSLSDHASLTANAAGSIAADRKLCDAVKSIVSSGYIELWDLGLEEIEIAGEAEAQRATVKRNPHIVRFASYTLDN